MRTRLAILAIFLASVPGIAQPPETTYPGTVIASGYIDDASYGPFNIGFTFNYYGNNYTQFYVNSNGMILFGTGSSESGSVTIPDAALPNNYIAPFWDDLVEDPSGRIMYNTTAIGAAPNRKLVVQFTNMGFYAPPPAILGTFQVILYESSNKIQVQYRLLCDNTNTRTHGGSATIGLENSTGTAGTLYAFHNSTAVNTEQAISFTPSGPNYIIDNDAIYDGIYLTSNFILPEPGITNQISPAQNAVIGSSQTFNWGAASYATSYTLKISQSSDLGGATTYSTSELSKLVSGLSLDTAYYWSVSSVNATGTTWGQIWKFRTSANPPLTAAPETNWVEKNKDITVQLDYSGGDASAKTGIITILPPTGALYQYNNGLRGAQITSVPTTLTDTSRKVIYAAGSTTGNGKGNFKFYIHDNTGDSPEAQVTINVSPAAIPNVLYVAKGTGVEVQFDIPMSDPTGKQGEFTVKVNGSNATINSAALKTGDPYTISLSLATPLTGTETVNVAYTAGTVTGASGGILATFSDMLVTLKSQTITFVQSLTKKYNESPFALTAGASSGLGLAYTSSNFSVATISVNIVTLRGIGTSDITARQPGNATWAPAKYVRTLTVSKGDQTITFGSLPSKTYGDADFNLTATSSSGLTITYLNGNSSVATINTSTVHITGAGVDTITATQPGNTYFNAAPSVKQALTVNKANQTITFPAIPAKTYGDPDFALSASSSSGLPVILTHTNPLADTIISGTVHILAAGTDTITASQPGNGNYNAATSVKQVLVINKADQTITFTAIPAKTYGDAYFALSASSSSGLPVTFTHSNHLADTIVSGTVQILAAGTDTITASQPGNSNYNAAANVKQVLIINKADQAITFAALPVKTYGDADFDPAASASSGLTVNYSSDNTAVATIASGMIHIVGAGTAKITASQTGNSNYNAAPDADQTLTVAKAMLTFTADNQTKEYLAPFPNLTYTITGFLNGDNIFMIDTMPTLGVHALITSPVGDYPLFFSSAWDNNYDFTLINGTLTITKISQTITFTRVPEKLLVSDTFRLAAVSTSGLTVSFESLDNGLATVSGSVLTGVSRGNVTIRAYNDGDENYQAAETTAVVEISSTHKDIMYLFTPNGDGFNDYWELPKLQEWGKCNVRVYNRWGKLVYSNPDYDNLWNGTFDGNPLPEGAYYFVIKTENAGTVSGTVNIVR